MASAAHGGALCDSADGLRVARSAARRTLRRLAPPAAAARDREPHFRTRQEPRPSRPGAAVLPARWRSARHLRYFKLNTVKEFS